MFDLKKGVTAIVNVTPNPGQPASSFLVTVNDDQSVQVGMLVMDAELKANGLANCKMQHGFGQSFAEFMLQVVNQIKAKSDSRIIVVGG